MRKKITASLQVFMIAALVAVGTIAMGSLFMVSLEVHCELQDDQSYICQARNTYLGWTLSEVNASQVYDVDQDLTCSGSGNKKGCSAHAEFLTTPGERVVVSRRYTDPSEVQKVVNALKPLMTGKSTLIDMVFPPSTFVSVTIISVASCIVILLLLTAIVMLFGKDGSELQPRVVDPVKKD